MKAQHPWWVTPMNLVATLMGLFPILVGLIVLSMYDYIPYVTTHGTGVVVLFGGFFVSSGILVIHAVWSESQQLISVAVRLLGIVMGVVTQLLITVFAVLCLTDAIPNHIDGVLYVYVLFGTAVGSTALLRRLFPSLSVFRRYIRRRKGLCLQCGYDLRGADHEACPECGHTC